MITPGIDMDALTQGFVFGTAIVVAIWGSVIVLSLLRKLLTDAV